MAEIHADIPWGRDQRKKLELFIQPAMNLNDVKETLEKVCQVKSHLNRDQIESNFT